MSSNEPKRYDAFLSYNSQDRLAVKQVAERLRGENLDLYLEECELAPGREFQPALAEALHESKTCVVFLGPNGLGPWQKQELQVAIDKRAREQDFHVIPVLLPGAERPRRGDVAHLEFLINASWVEFLKTLDDEVVFRKLVWGIRGTKPSESDTRYERVCPYRGLEAFRPEDAKFFFGRENLTGWLVSALRRETRAMQGVRFLGVLGPSGSGKSSVVLAGLVPRLTAGAIEGSERWPVAILRPGDDPLKNLAAGVVARFLPTGALPDAAQVLKLADDLRADAQALDVFAQVALHNQPEGVQLVVVVDQFEEVFTNRPQDDQARARFEQDRDRFFANLLQAAAPGGRVAVVLTMRSDFVGACATYPQLAAVLSAHQELVGEMTAAELREAIERPAFRVGCEVESGLTERLLADVAGQPGALPLLQFALTEVWKKRDIRRLTLRAYTELGKDDRGEPRGIEGVLEHRADEIYRNLKPEDQDLCRRLFLRLVQPGEGTEDTKRRVSYRELLPDDPTRAEAVKRLVRTLADRDARLITTEVTKAAEGAVEVAHEALIQGWTQLRRWVDAERTGLRVQRRLTEAAQEWAAASPEHKEDYLYSGARLAVSREWVETHRDELSSIETAFLAVSEEAERERKQDALENERRLREAAEAVVAQQRALAAEERRRRRLWVRSVASFLAAVTVMGSLVWYWRAESTSRHVADKLLTAQGSQIEPAIQYLGERGSPFWTDRILKKAIEDAAHNQNAGEDAVRKQIRDKALRAMLILVRDDRARHADALFKRLFDCDFHEFKAICNSLDKLEEKHRKELKKTFAGDGKLTNDLQSKDERRFRAGLALAKFSDTSDWNEPDFDFLARKLLNVNSADWGPAIQLLKPVSKDLLCPLECLDSSTGLDEVEQNNVAVAMLEFAAGDNERLVRLACRSNPHPYRTLVNSTSPIFDVKSDAAQRELKRQVREHPVPDATQEQRRDLGRRRALAAITLLRRGLLDDALEALRVTDDPESITQFCARCGDYGVSAEDLFTALNNSEKLEKPPKRPPEENTRFLPASGTSLERQYTILPRFALILALGSVCFPTPPSGAGGGQPALAGLRDDDRQRLRTILLRWFEHDQSSAIHGATGWVLRKWANVLDDRVVKQRMKEIERVLAVPCVPKKAPEKEWFVLHVLPDEYLTFIVFKGGDFKMGSPKDLEKFQRDNESPQHRVKLTRRFAICDCEVTPEQFKCFKNESITWYHAVAFCNWLSNKVPDSEQCYSIVGTDPERVKQLTIKEFQFDKRGFRLPTEAEWEYVCRAGTSTPYGFGSDSTLLERHGVVLTLDPARAGKRQELGGEYWPNLRGVFDLHGNDFEWCCDKHSEVIYRQRAENVKPGMSVDDPFFFGDLENNSRRVLRGGSWDYNYGAARSAYRRWDGADNKDKDYGFRIVVTLP